MKAILLLLIAIALVITAQMRDHQHSNPIGPTDEIINMELHDEARQESLEDDM